MNIDGVSSELCFSHDVMISSDDLELVLSVLTIGSSLYMIMNRLSETSVVCYG